MPCKSKYAATRTDSFTGELDSGQRRRGKKKHTATVDSSASSALPLIHRFIGLSVTGSISFIIMHFAAAMCGQKTCAVQILHKTQVALVVRLSFCCQDCVREKEEACLLLRGARSCPTYLLIFLLYLAM